MSKNNQDREFGKRFAKLLKEKKLTVREAAKIADVGISTIQGWKVGTQPSGAFWGLAKLATKLGVSFEYLLTGEHTTQPGLSDLLVDGGNIFDGYLKVKIQRVIPKVGIKEENED